MRFDIPNQHVVRSSQDTCRAHPLQIAPVLFRFRGDERFLLLRRPFRLALLGGSMQTPHTLPSVSHREMPNWLFAFFMGSALLVGVVAGTFGILHS
jgi:hypothetical protein